MWMTGNHLVYLAVSILVTVVVAGTLKKHGRVFLIDVFAGDVQISDAVNQSLVVGFYLVNIAMVALAVKYGGVANNLEQSIELLSTKIGWVLLILGGMHVFNVIVLSVVSRRKPVA